MLSNYPNCCSSCRREYRNQRLAELYRIVTGDYRYGGSSNNFPSSLIVAKTLKAGSSSLRPIIPTRKRRIILHPESQRLNQERVGKLAELSKFIRGQDSQPK